MKRIEITEALITTLTKSAHLGQITAARRAGIGYSTLREWLRREGEPYDTLQRRYFAAMADDAEVLIAEAKAKDPVKMLSVLHGIREKERKPSALTVNAQGANVLVLAREIASQRLPPADLRGLLTQGDDDGSDDESRH